EELALVEAQDRLEPPQEGEVVAPSGPVVAGWFGPGHGVHPPSVPPTPARPRPRVPAHCARQRPMRTIVVTGSASGMGAATKARLEAAGDRVIGVDVKDADVVADLGTAGGRQAAVDAVAERSGGAIDGLVTWAGLAGLTNRPGSLLVSV